MKNPVIFKVFTIAAFSAFFLVNAGNLWCASPPGSPGNLAPQAKSTNNAIGNKVDQNWLADQEEKSERFQELEWLIKQKLLSQYEKMEIREPLEELPD